MSWKKLGLVFDIENVQIPWLRSHAMIPTPFLMDDRIRVFFTGRNTKGQSQVSYVDVDRSDPRSILYVHDQPLFDVGGIGTFDDCGILATCVVRDENKVYMYYTAYSIAGTVPYRNSIGVAISRDGGNTFSRMFNGPIVDRSRDEPFFTISPWVLKVGDLWHMWYASATGWIEVNGKPESLYHIKYAYSKDAIVWSRENVSCVHVLHPDEANARPSVVLDGDTWKMWFCYRGSADFRDGKDSYRIGYAEAPVAVPTCWHRDDASAGIACGPEPFDEKMQAYPCVCDVDGRRYLFYNGNGFGVDGFCCAEWFD